MLAVLDILTKQNNETFLIDLKTGKESTYKNHYEQSCKIAGWLQEEGFQKNDTIGILLDNSILFAEFYFACLYSGIIIVPMSPLWTADQIDFVLLHSKAKAVLTTENYYQQFSPSLRNSYTWILPESDKKISCVKLLKLETSTKFSPKKIDGENIALIAYTSGTTAEPKGVVHTIQNLVNNGTLFSKTLRLNKTLRFFNCLPMNYLGGCYNLLLIPYLSGASVVIAPAFSTAMAIRFWKDVSLYNANAIWLVPSILAILMNMDRGNDGKEYCRDNIKLACIGTAPLRRELKKQFESRYQISLYESYGITETLFISTHVPHEASPEQTIGKVLSGTEIKILDSQGNALPIGEPGEIAIKTLHLMKEYHHLNTKNYFDNEGYFLTGDIGLLTENKEIILLDRKKDMIIKGGVNISPAAVEKVLYKNPHVEICAVVGIPDPLAGEEIVAVVKTKDNILLSEIENALKKLCHHFLSLSQQPKIYLSLSQFPYSTTGKIQKAKIREWAKIQLTPELMPS